MHYVLIVLALIAGVIATILGFGFVNDAEWVEDFSGWFALALTFFIAAHLPYDRFNRHE